MSRLKSSPLPVSSGVYFPGAPKIGDLSLPQKQELLYEVANGFEGGREALKSWTRKDLLQLLCLEMGKERKYTGVSKSKMVEHLLRLVSAKELGEEETSPDTVPITYPFISQSPARRQRKGGRPSELSSTNHTPEGVDSKKPEFSLICRNIACRAQLSPGVNFCKRCSCCLCQQFDDNKDPSLWIVCTAEPLGEENGCGLSCHLECALDSGIAGVIMDGLNMVLDGSYRCGPCGRVSGMIGCWRKQLLIAKDARRVDILCQRLTLSHRLLNGTRKYRAVHDIVDRATKKLEAEVGSITEGSAKLVRGIVNRLSCGAEVQNLISTALDKAETLHKEPILSSQPRVEGSNFQGKEMATACKIDFTEVSSSSIMVTVEGGSQVAGEPLIGYRLWHRKASDPSYPNNPTCIIPGILGRALISSLQACSEYAFRIAPFSEKTVGGFAEARCFTKSIEVIKRPLALMMESHLNMAHNQQEDILNVTCAENKEFCNTDEFTSNFKVRELGKVLHSVWGQEYQSADIVEGIFLSTGGAKNSGSEKNNEERNSEHVSPALNVLLSPGADASSVEDGTCNTNYIAVDRDLNAGADIDPGLENGRVKVGMGLLAPPIKACLRKDSSGLSQENEALQSSKDAFLVSAKVMELDSASDPGNSQVSGRQENDAVSPDVSDSLQANVTNELNEALEENRRTDDLESNGHGESWAVQVRSGSAAVGMDPHTAILRKRTVGGLERADSCYGLVNGCGGRSAAVPLCAAKNYEFCVKIIRWLECEGHLKEDFRMKFLTWFSLRASDHEKRVVSVFIDTLQDNPASLAEQLMDTFEEIISSKRHQVVANSFRNRLWH